MNKDSWQPMPCPFCGGRAELFVREYTDAEASYGNAYVACTKCRTEQPYRRGKADAIAAWNTRAIPPKAMRG